MVVKTSHNLLLYFEKIQWKISKLQFFLDYHQKLLMFGFFFCIMYFYLHIVNKYFYSALEFLLLIFSYDNIILYITIILILQPFYIINYVKLFTENKLLELSDKNSI